MSTRPPFLEALRRGPATMAEAAALLRLRPETLTTFAGPGADPSAVILAIEPRELVELWRRELAARPLLG